MDKRLVFLLLFALLLFPILNAKPSVTVSTVGGIEILSPVFEYHPANTTFDFYWHVFNGTRTLTNTTTNCSFHLYDKQNHGEHIVTMTKVAGFSNGRDYEVEVLGGNFSKIGAYCALIECNTTTQTGGREQCFEVTYNGKELSTAQGILYVPLFMVLGLFLFIIFFIIQKLPESNEVNEEGKIMSISYLKYLRPTLWLVEWMLVIAILYLASNLAFAFTSETLFATILLVLFRICLGVTPIIAIVWVAYMFVSFFHDREFQNLLNRGIFPQGKL